ncbi:MAG: T9SS type A sorting domain-containing protein, partial [Bacteroidota bacterium]
GFLIDHNLADNEPDTITLNVPPNLVEDQQLLVVIGNLGSVDYNEDFANQHTVELFQTGSVPWLTLEPEYLPIVGPGSDEAIMSFSAENLFAGEYYTSVTFSSSDPIAEPEVLPITMIVTGVPVLETDRDTIDFGSHQITTRTTETIYITNPGTASLSFNPPTLPDDGVFSSTYPPVNLAPGELILLDVDFTPPFAGDFERVLTLTSEEGISKEIVLRGRGLSAAVLGNEPDTIHMTLLQGQDTTITGLNISNEGEEPLRYNLGKNAGKTVVWEYAFDEDAYTTGVAPVLSTVADNIDVSLLNTADPDIMISALSQADILLIPNLFDPDPAVLEAMRQPIQLFLQRGGRVLLLGGANGEVPLALGLFNAAFVRVNPDSIPMTQMEGHPVFAGIDETIFSTEETHYLVGNLGQVPQVLSRMFGNPCILINQIGRGEVIYIGFTYHEVSEHNQLILENALLYAKGETTFPNWLSITPDMGMLDIAEMASHQISFDATALAVNTYNWATTLYSNDPNIVETQKVIVRLEVELDTETTDEEIVEKLVLYPNPTADLLYLDIELKEVQHVNWELTTIEGRKVQSGNFFGFGSPANAIYLGSLPSGNYFLRLFTEAGEQFAVRKVVKK